MDFTAGSIHKPAVVSTHHQQWVHSSPTVYEPAVMTPSITNDLNPTPPKSAVMLISNRR